MKRSPPTGRVPGYRPSRLGRVLILFVTCGSLATIAAVWWYYTLQSRETEAATRRQLYAVAQAKAEQIANWRHERMGDGRAVLTNLSLRLLRRLLATSSPSAVDRADVLDIMARLSSQFLYSDITLADRDGNVTLRFREETTEGAQFRKHSRSALVHEASTARDAVLSDIRPDTRDGRPLMALTVPVSDMGALILDIDPSRFLYPYLDSWPGSSSTGETLLVRLEGDQIVYLSKARNAPASTLFTHRKVHTIPSQSVLDAGWTVEDIDYRGVRAFGNIRHITDSPWYLICKMDVAEVEAPLRRLGWEMAALTALIALANAAGVGLIWRGQQSRLHHEREAWFYAIANDTPAYLWMASPGDEHYFINQPLQRFLGVSQQRPSLAWEDYVHPDDATSAQSKFLECLAAARGYSEEFRIRRVDGAWRWVVVEAVPRFSSEGRFVGFAGSLLDTTERHLAEEQLRSANATLVVQLDEAIRKEREIEELGARLINAQEEERTRLARELHDDLNQQIAALSIGMANLKRKIPTEQSEARWQSDQIHHKLVDIAESVRRLSHELHPEVLRYSGLAAALQQSCQEFETISGIHASLAIDGCFENIPPDTALCVYRITQEALRNVAKHAHVQSASVLLRRGVGLLSLTVSDRGVGMPVGTGQRFAGLGLISIRERVRLVRGTLEITSQPNQGTTISVRIPDAGNMRVPGTSDIIAMNQEGSTG
ncbi:MAG TPA: PAS domain-containing protein [Bryobacteraceae bacterium]|nr:PAS domain-containing protein [Bryobacteraceae bacterium]